MSFYDPTTGQFLTRDPLDALTRSAYGYVYDNPLNDTDPTGLWCVVHNDHGGCKGSGVVKKAGSVATGAAKTVGRCFGDPNDCVENIEIASTPLVAAGLTATMFYGLAAACSFGGPIGCVVGAVFLGSAAAAGVYATWKAGEAFWWGEGRDRIYHRLGGEEEGALAACGLR
jgi:hypothetical protein